MSDNLRRLRAIRQSLTQLYPVEVRGHLACRLHTLSALISGIVGSRSCQFPRVAMVTPTSGRVESCIKKILPIAEE